MRVGEPGREGVPASQAPTEGVCFTAIRPAGLGGWRWARPSAAKPRWLTLALRWPRRASADNEDWSSPTKRSSPVYNGPAMGAKRRSLGFGPSSTRMPKRTDKCMTPGCTMPRWHAGLCTSDAVHSSSTRHAAYSLRKSSGSD